ncbi:MAG: NAD(P)-binding protein [Ilumatobacteraceae bacterium]
MEHSDGLDFDPDALRDRYRRARDKRLRADGVDQYREGRDELARFVDVDPLVSSEAGRDPVDEDVDGAIVGAGFSGLLAAARLSERGVTTFRIVDAGADFGCTWYWNRYPGAQCDTDAYCYLPLLEEFGYMPKEKYAYADEIFEHSKRIGQHHGLCERTHFATRVTSLEWGDSIDRWHLRTDRGSSPVGSASDARTSTRSRWAGRSRPTWSTTGGPTSSERSRHRRARTGRARVKSATASPS